MEDKTIDIRNKDNLLFYYLCVTVYDSTILETCRVTSKVVYILIHNRGSLIIRILVDS